VTDAGCKVVSLREGIDFTTDVGKLVASVLFAVSAFETRQRRSRQEAGIAARKTMDARAREEERFNEVKYKGKEAGCDSLKVRQQRATVEALLQAGVPIMRIARDLHLSRGTVYRIREEKRALSCTP
jgi:DNA invertase Pin-like site-specific DNA recombinase